MPWFRVDDKFHSDPKRLGCSLAAIGLWTVAGSWSADHLTDGKVPTKVLRMHGSRPKLVRELVEVGLWIDEKPNGFDGVSFKNWADYQPTKSDVETRRERLREAGRAGGRRSGQSRKPKTDEAEPKHDASQTLRQQANETEARPVEPPTRTHTHTDTSNEVSLNTSPTASTQPIDESGHVYPTTLDRLAEAEEIVEAELVDEPVAPAPADPTPYVPKLAGDQSEPIGFAEWYSHYPRKAGRKNAAKAYAKARKSVTAAQLLVAVRRFAADPNLPTDKTFIAHPATWLNEGRWDDEPLPPRRDGARPTRNQQNRDYLARRYAERVSDDRPALDLDQPMTNPYRPNHQIGA